MENLRKSFIVDEKQYERERIPSQVRRVLRYCKVSKEGKVLLEKNSFTHRDNLKLILVARFLASKLDPSIKEEVSIDELLSSMGKNNRDSLITRMKEIVDAGIAKRPSQGLYSIIPYYVDSILDKLDTKTRR